MVFTPVKDNADLFLVYFCVTVGRTDPCRTLKCLYGQRCVLDGLGEARCECSGENECSEDFNEPVCGSDWRDYQSVCHVRKASCLTNQNIEVKYKGLCGRYTKFYIFITTIRNVYNKLLYWKVIRIIRIRSWNRR